MQAGGEEEQNGLVRQSNNRTKQFQISSDSL